MVTTLSLFENKKTAEACQQKNGLTAEAMRRILIDNARKKKSEKRGGQQRRIDWHNNIQAPAKATDDLLAIDEALIQLAAEDAEAAQLVKLRFYAGLSVDEAADVMGLARATAYRTWNYAKAWLRTKLDGVMSR